MGFLEKRFEVGNQLDKFLTEYSNLPKEELQEKLNDFFIRRNEKMEEIIKKLGGGLGEFIHKAERLVNKGNYKGALIICEKILDIHPTCEEILLLKADCLFHLEKQDESLDCTKILLEINPHCDQAYCQLAVIMFSVGDYNAALKAINDSLRIYSKNFDSIILKAQILYQLKRPSYKKWIEKAKQIDLKRAENFMENFWDEEILDFQSMMTLTNSIGETNEYMEKKEFNKALEILDRLIHLKLDRTMKEVVYSMKIECLIGLKDHENAEKFIQKLIKINKDYPMAYFHRAVIKFNTLYFDEALKETNTCIKVAEKVNMRHPQYYLLKAELLKKLNDQNYKKFGKIAKELERENMKIFKQSLKESGMTQKGFKKPFEIK